MKLFSKKNITWAVVMVVVLFSGCDYQNRLVFGQGTYRDQFGKYAFAIKEELKKQNLCKSDLQCPEYLEFYGDSSLQISVGIYNIEGNEILLAKYLEAALIYGRPNAEGVPIKIEGYLKPRKYYLDNNSQHKPYLIMEIK
ncbi:MAG: hypothetical protein H6R05_646 [Burkholderiaceae bacterium]|nr:hypothetical protein [Burkholderiaceae bacterium]